jgi:PAS domain S-box-containing protein
LCQNSSLGEKFGNGFLNKGLAKENVGEKVELLANQPLNTTQGIKPILDAIPFYALLVDSGHAIIAVNKAFEDDFGLSPEQFIGAHCPLLVHNLSTPIAECPLVEAIEKGVAVEREVFDPPQSRWMLLAVYPTSLTTPEDRPIYLHFARDITQLKNSAAELSRSLEHHSALCDLLQKFQYSQNSAQILEALIDKLLSLSWLGMTATAVGFLVKAQGLEMTACRNLNPQQLKRCAHLAPGECLCGRVAQTGDSIVCSSTCQEHNIRYEEMDEHRHAVMPISHEGRVLGVLTLYLNSGDNLDAFRLDFLKAATAAAGATLAGHFARENAKRIREKFMAKVISYQEDERQRIAQELHDHVAQSLSALLLQMQTHGSQHEALREIQRSCEGSMRGLIDEVRQMAVRLRPAILDDYGLELALARYIKELSARTGLAIDYQFVSSKTQEKRLPAPIEVGLYRAAMEALNNIASHASASQASLVIIWQPEKVLLLVEDDGCGFDYAATRRDIDHCLGLIDMEERIRLLGGTLRIDSKPRKGTTVRAELPLSLH